MISIRTFAWTLYGLYGVSASALAFGSPPPPPAAVPSFSTVVGIVSDLNGTECQPVYPRNSVLAFENLLRHHSPTHIIMPGDMVHGECLSYRGAKPYAEVVTSMWQSFETHFLAKIPNGTSVTVAPGNHDAPWVTSSSRQTFRLENEGFKTYWNKKEATLGVKRLQVAGAQDNYPYYWAYVHDDILFITLNSVTTSSLSDGTRQKAWLRALLTSPQATAAKARIAYGHVPPYPVLDPSVGSKYSAVLSAEQVGKASGLMDMLLDLNVDVLVAAHSHAPYPGVLTRKKDGKRMKILSMPCGHAARKLYSHTSVSPRGFAILNIDRDARISVSIKEWSAGQALPLDFFPAKIDVRDSRVDYQRVPQSDYR